MGKKTLKLRPGILLEEFSNSVKDVVSDVLLVNIDKLIMLKFKNKLMLEKLMKVCFKL